MSAIKVLLALFVCLTLQIVTNFAYAESEFRDEEYNKFVTEVFIQAEKPIAENYKKLRELYAQTSFYDPNFQAPEIKDAVMKLTQKNLSEDEFYKRQRNLADVSIKHMGHINIHKYTSDFYWSIGRKDLAARVGEIANHIALSAVNGGDGLGPKTAFKAINKAEQVFILEYFLKKNYSTQRLENIEGRLYDVYETYDKERNGSSATQNKVDIYFDITDYFGKGVTARAIQQQLKEQSGNENPINKSDVQ